MATVSAASAVSLDAADVGGLGGSVGGLAGNMNGCVGSVAGLGSIMSCVKGIVGESVAGFVRIMRGVGRNVGGGKKQQLLG